MPLYHIALSILDRSGVDETQSSSGNKFKDSSARNFQVSFNFWQLQVPAPPATNSKKRKKNPGGKRPSKMKSTVPKYENYNPKVPISLTLNNLASMSFVSFKLQLFQACDQKLPWVSESLGTAWSVKAVDIQGFINGSRKHKAKKMVISDQESLREFIAATQEVPSSTPMGFKIHHENPKITANASRFAQTLRRGCGPGRNDPPSDETEGDPRSEDSSDILSPGERKLRILMERFAKDFKRGENVTSVVNPQDPSLCMLLNTARLRTWANDWADAVPGVDDVNPPTRRPGFRWIPVANYEKEKNLLLGLGPTIATASSPGSALGTVVHHNYYGQPFPSPGFPPAPPSIPGLQLQPPYPNVQPFAFAPGQLPTPPGFNATSPRLSPPPLIPTFEEFLLFAGIKPEMTKTRDILADQGIDEFVRLLDRNTYTFENFRSMGIPFAHADDITKAVPEFNKHLKQLGSRNGSDVS
ncbi:hypothetical protein DFH28DRAFT_912482 [Melampsora americana]|nr:hypothetical protein DFH28DRAFT_912482 [Melampsora americana]